MKARRETRDEAGNTERGRRGQKGHREGRGTRQRTERKGKAERRVRDGEIDTEKRCTARWMRDGREMGTG